MFWNCNDNTPKTTPSKVEHTTLQLLKVIFLILILIRIPSEIKNWAFSGGKIINTTAKGIFYMGTNVENYTEFYVKNSPISGIESIDKTHFVYVTPQGIEVFDTASKTAKLVIAKVFNKNEYNNLQIKYIAK